MRQLVLAVSQESASTSLFYFRVPHHAVIWCLFLLELYCSFSTLLSVGSGFFLIYIIAIYKFKIKNVTQLLEFHALSDHQTDHQSDDRLVRETRVTVLHFLS